MTDHLSNCQDIAPHLPSPALPKVLVSQGYVQFLPCRDTLFIPQPSKWQVNLTPQCHSSALVPTQRSSFLPCPWSLAQGRLLPGVPSCSPTTASSLLHASTSVKSFDPVLLCIPLWSSLPNKGKSGE